MAGELSRGSAYLLWHIGRKLWHESVYDLHHCLEYNIRHSTNSKSQQMMIIDTIFHVPVAFIPTPTITWNSKINREKTKRKHTILCLIILIFDKTIRIEYYFDHHSDIFCKNFHLIALRCAL